MTADHSESTSVSAHDERHYFDVEPRSGQIVMFRSREVWHSINEPSLPRWAVTLWVLADSS